MWDEIRKLIRHTSVYGIGNLIGKIAGFLLIPFYTHYLKPAEYGTLELLDLSLALITMLLNVWAAAPLIRFYYEYDDEREKRKVVSTALLTATAGATVLTCTGLIFSKDLSSLLLKSPNFSYYVRLIVVCFFLSVINSVAWSYLRARQRSAFIVLLNFISLVLMLSLNIYFIAVLHLGVLGVLYSGLLANYLLNAVIILFVTIREVGLAFDIRKLRAFAVFGAPLIFTNIGAFILNFSDRFFLQHYSTMSIVGIYALGYKFGFMLSFLLIQPFNMIWCARMYEIAKKPDGREMFAKFATYFCLILAVGVLAMSVVIKDIIRIMAAPDFSAAYQIVPVIGFSYLFQGMGNYFQTGIFIQKKTIYMGIIGVVGTISNLLLNFILVPRYASMGAAWATALSFLMMAILAYGFSQKIYPIPYRIWKLCMPVVVAVVLYLGSTQVVIATPFLSVTIKLLFVPIFLAALYLLGFLERREIEKFKSVLSVLLARYRWGGAVLPGQ